MLSDKAKCRLTALACVAALLVVLFVISLFVPLYNEMCDPNEYTHQKECSQYHLGPFVLLWIVVIADAHNGLVGAMAAVFVAAFTGTLWWSTDKQGRLTQQSIDLAREEFETAQRAFVSVDFAYELSLIDDSESGRTTVLESTLDRSLFVTRFAVQPIWKNEGNTPTRNLRVRVDWGTPSVMFGPGNYRGRETTGFLAPKSSFKGEIIEMPGGLNSVIQNGFPSTPTVLLIWGRADYDDIFGAHHFIEWCYRIRPSRIHQQERLTASFIQWPEYNRSDET